MPGRKTFILTVMAILFLGFSGWGSATGPAPDPAGVPLAPPNPDKILKEMADFLKSQKQFSFRADVTDDQVYGQGYKLQYAMDLEVFMRRPDKLLVKGQGDLENQELFYDGKTLTLYQKDKNLYASAAMPPTIEEALTQAHRDLDVQVALADFASGNLYDFMIDDVTQRLYVGLNRVRGVMCHHLAFDQDDLYWQIWIETGDKPFPRKMLITQKLLPGSPQWTAYLGDWNLSPELADTLFTFTAPAEARKIQFIPPSAGEVKTTPRSKKKGKKP
jgi:hypothetical protein